MPYISQDDREKLKHTLKLLVYQLDSFSDEDIEGVMNYCITYIINERMRPYYSGSWRYKWINRAIGILETVKLEFYRRVGTKCEDEAIIKTAEELTAKCGICGKPCKPSMEFEACDECCKNADYDDD